MAKSTPGTSASKGSAQTIPNRGFGSSPIFRPQPRPPFGQFYGSGASNFYRRPSYSYGVPTGLGSLLSGQQSPFGRMVDPATGFPQRSFPRPVMGRPDFGQIGRSTSSGKSGSKGGASTVNPSRPENVQVSDVSMEGVENAQLFGNNPPPSLTDQPMMRSQGPESLMGRVDSGLRFGEPAIGRVSQPIMPRPDLIPAGPAPSISQIPDLIPARPARSVSQTPEESLRQRALAGNRTGTGLDLPPAANPLRAVELMPPLAPPPPPPPPPSIAPPSSPIIPDVRQQIEREIQMERAGVRPNVRPAPAPVIVPKPAPVVAAPTSPSDVQQQIMRQIQIEQAGVRPNVRPTMNVGKATGGPVGIHSGIASLAGRR